MNSVVTFQELLVEFKGCQVKPIEEVLRAGSCENEMKGPGRFLQNTNSTRAGE